MRLIRDGIVASLASSIRNRNQMVDELRVEKARDTARAVSIGAGGAWVFHDAMNIACAARIRQERGADELTQQAFTEGYWSFEVLRHGWGDDFSAPTRVLPHILSFCGLCYQGGKSALGDWMAEFAYKAIAGVRYPELREPDLLEFYRTLLSARRTGVWPVRHKVSGSLGAMRPLIMFADAPERFAAALGDYLDLRLARAFRHAGHESMPQVRASTTPSFFEDLWRALIPVELFLLSAAAEKCLGSTPMLDPLQGILMGDLAPSAFDLTDSVFSHDMRLYGMRTFGSAWRPAIAVSLQGK